MVSSASLILSTKYRNNLDYKKRFNTFNPDKKIKDTERLLVMRFKWIVALTSLSGLSALLLIVLYSWNLDRFYKIYTTVVLCQFYAPGLLIDPQNCKKLIKNQLLCNFVFLFYFVTAGMNLVVIDFLFIAIGIIGIILNSILLYTTLRSTPKTYFYKEPRVLISPPPRLDHSQVLV